MLAEMRYIKKFGLFGNKMRYMNKFINLTFWFNPIFYLVMIYLIQRLFAIGLFNAISMAVKQLFTAILQLWAQL